MNKHHKVKLAIELKPRSKIWIEKGNEYALGGGIAQILSAIRKTSSIKNASVLLKESYRYVWGRIQKTEEVMGVKLVETIVGGQSKARTQLTEFANRIIDPYLKFESTARKQIDRAFEQMMKDINKKGSKK